MRTMLLSFKPEIYDKIASGEKVLEYRYTFPNEPIKAYAYISRPVKAIGGIIYLDNRIELKALKDRCKKGSDVEIRLVKHMDANKYVMQIKAFQETNRIPLSELKNFDDRFVIPQMYYFLDELPLLNYIEEKLIAEGEILQNKFEKESILSLM